MDLKKGTVTLQGVPIAAISGTGWKLTPGVRPYIAQMSVHKDVWERRLKQFVGQSVLRLQIVDARGVEMNFEKLTILHDAPSPRPNLVSFFVADKRWKWQYLSIHRDINITRKTGNRTADLETVPVEVLKTVDEYRYFPYSLDGQEEERWSPKRAVEDFLEFMEDATQGGSFTIDSFPIVDSGGGEGQFTLQNVSVRDQADVALSRLLATIPGAEVYINMKGDAVVYDGTDMDAAEDLFKELPPATWAGEKSRIIDRSGIRPRLVTVFYGREVESVFEFEDDYSGGTQANPVSGSPFIDNVIPTVDTQTTVTEYDAYFKTRKTKTVPPGTFVTFAAWLVAMNKDRPDGSLPWTFETIKTHWLKGDLDAVLGGRGLDLDEEANVSMRIQALKQHFRQTFRINRAYMESIRDVRAVRVALLDPVTGARAPAAVWGEACVVPSTKGKLMASRFPANTKVFRNVDYLAKHVGAGTLSNPQGQKLIKTHPGPARVSFIDKDIGVFRLDWILSPYGDVESFVPCHLVEESDESTPAVINRDFALQDTKAMGAGMKIDSGTNGIFLRNRMRYKVMLTIVPATPNNANIYHFYDIKPADVRGLFSSNLKIQNGRGPTLEVIVPPGEATARFAWDDDKRARETIETLLGLDVDNPNDGGVTGNEMPGFVHINEKSHLDDHAISVAAEALVPFADSRQGTVATQAPKGGNLELKGNMSAVTVRISGSPGAKVDVLWQFPGQQKSISRLALMPESVRQIVGGVLPYPSET